MWRKNDRKKRAPVLFCVGKMAGKREKLKIDTWRKNGGKKKAPVLFCVGEREEPMNIENR